MAESNSNIRAPDALIIDINSTSMASIWELWSNNLEMYFLAAGIADTKRQKALLLYLGGENLRQIHRNLGDDKEEYKDTKEFLDTYFKPKKNVTFERNKFYSTHPNADEITSAYVTRLKDLSRSCGFDTYSSDSAVVDQVITKCKSNRLRRRLLREPNLTLPKLLEVAYATEAAEEQASQIEHEQVDQLSKLSMQVDQLSKLSMQENSADELNSVSKQNINYIANHI